MRAVLVTLALMPVFAGVAGSDARSSPVALTLLR
jgi:hypothetical protein